MILYFVIMWTAAFFLVYKLSIRKGGSEKYGYKMAVVQVSPLSVSFCTLEALLSPIHLDRASLRVQTSNMALFSVSPRIQGLTLRFHS